ncbi:uncharacterized protein G2W53_026711 [Senna tora]|uniref:PB1-like domain-containing protein n=1 Tax=Senna tora TaxID=362788 RepID=A0A834WJ11_9FABA|nr:uncharacterized protein G2W53_026711 [Senna tora]
MENIDVNPISRPNFNKWSFFEMKDGISEMGHNDKYDMWFADPNVHLEDSLRPVVDDRQTMEMVNYYKA